MADRGPERISAAFEAASQQGRAALMPYLMGGYPDLPTSLEIASAYVDAGADLVEIGIPYSDPLADGPVIQEAATVALGNGVGVEEVLGVASSISERVPVILLAYSGLVIGGGGPAEFARQVAAAGVSGVVIPDLPLGTDESIRAELATAGLAVVPLVAPTTTGERRREILETASGFVYLVSDVGTTGARERLPAHLADLVREVSDQSPAPVAVGFGIGTVEQAAEVGRFADGVIIGSRLVALAGEGGPPAVAEFLDQTLAAMADSGRDGLR
ncbi:MAG: tryptophan synthase subunit alpha [Solirubrobacterales bacterium]